MKSNDCRKQKAHHRGSTRRWSGHVTRTSHALDLEPGVFTGDNPKEIAASVKRSAERSKRRKANACRSALSMITFYLNRGGRNIPAKKRDVLERARIELKRQFDCA